MDGMVRLKGACSSRVFSCSVCMPILSVGTEFGKGEFGDGFWEGERERERGKEFHMVGLVW